MSMRGKFAMGTVLAIAAAAIGLMGAVTASASAESITCEISGSIKLSPGLSETPQIQTISITKHKGAALTGCSGSETPITGGNVTINMKTEAPVTCAALKSAGEPVGASNAIFKWTPKGLGNSTSTFEMPLSEERVPLKGHFSNGSVPMSERTISGNVTQTYIGGGTCGVSSGHKKAKKVNKGSFTGSITIS